MFQAWVQICVGNFQGGKDLFNQQEATSVAFEDPYSDMTPEEKSKMIIELMAARQRDAERIQQDKTRINELLSKVNELLSMQKAFVTAKKTVRRLQTDGWYSFV